MGELDATRPGELDLRRFVRTFAVSLIVLGAVAVPLGLSGPSAPDTKGFASAADAARSVANLNEARAEGAPQQAVVNGWHTINLLEIQIRQTNDLLMLLHFGIAMFGAAVSAMIVAGGLALRPSRSATRKVEKWRLFGPDSDDVPASWLNASAVERARVLEEREHLDRIARMAQIPSDDSSEAAPPDERSTPRSLPEGWNADPTGRFDYRFWAGDRWTQQVLRGDEQGIDPNQSGL